jgi:hypothetical protein
MTGKVAMKIVSINDTPTVCNEDGVIRGNVTDLNRILDNIDAARGLPDAIRNYVLALRDLQRSNDEFAFDAGDGSAIDQAEAAVAEAFESLIIAQRSLIEAVGI